MCKDCELGEEFMGELDDVDLVVAKATGQFTCDCDCDFQEYSLVDPESGPFKFGCAKCNHDSKSMNF